MLKGFLKLSCLLSLVVVFLCNNTRAQFLSLSDENIIGLTLDRLEKAMQKTDTLQVFTILGTQILVKGEMVDSRSQVRSIFERASNRKMVISPPPNAENRKFWDLEFSDLSIRFAKDSTETVVNCKLKLWAAKTDVSRTIKMTPEIFRFKKVGNGWHLVGFDNLLDFLAKEVNTSEKD